MAGRGRAGAFASITPVVKWLLILNIGIYILDTILKGEARDGPIRIFGAFAIHSAFFEGRFWEVITFQFLHGSVGHILFNSIGLFFFGPWMERWWGAGKFLAFYLLSGIGGALFFTLLVYVNLLPGDDFYTPLIGASAGIYGILIGVAVIAPSLQVSLIFPPVTLSIRQLSMIILLIAVVSILFRLGGNEGGEAGHLGGAIVGFLLIKGWILLGNESENGARRGRPLTDFSAKIRPRTNVDFRTQTRIDGILDKISKDGFQSITEDERDILRRAAESEQDRS